MSQPQKEFKPTAATGSTKPVSDQSNTLPLQNFAGDTSQEQATLNVITQELKKLQALVKIRAFTFAYTLMARIATTTPPNGIYIDPTIQPTVKFNSTSSKNKLLDKDMRLCALSLIPDTAFKTHGVIQINVNEGINLLPLTNVADFTDIASMSIPIPDSADFILQRGKDIKVWAYDDGNASHITFIGLVASYEDIFNKVVQ